MLIQKQLYTVEAFEAFIAQPENVGRRLELINGEIVEKMPTLEHGVIALRIGSKLLIFVEANGLGWIAVEARYKVAHDAHNARLPDVPFTSTARTPRKTLYSICRI